MALGKDVSVQFAHTGTASVDLLDTRGLTGSDGIPISRSSGGVIDLGFEENTLRM